MEPRNKKRSLRKLGTDEFFSNWATDEAVEKLALTMRLAKEQCSTGEDHNHSFFTVWGKAIETFLQRKQAFAAWNVARENELQQCDIAAGNSFDAILEKYDGLFAEILTKYPIKTIHDFNAIISAAGVRAHISTTKMDQSLRGGIPKPDLLQELIEGVVSKKPSITAKELLVVLESMQGQGLIQDIEEGVIFFGKEGAKTEKAKVAGLKDRLSRAKKKIKENKSR